MTSTTGASRGIDPVAYHLDLLKNTPRARAVVQRVAQMADWGRKREGRGLGFSYLDYSGSQVAGIAEVSLDRGKGEIKVHDFWCTIDVGVPVQPDNVVAQCESSILYGLGLTLTELITIKNGVVEQNNFYDYRVPRMNDVPQMHIEVIATDNHPTRRRPDGDAAGGARDRQRGGGAHRRAATPHPVHARAGQGGAWVRPWPRRGASDRRVLPGAGAAGLISRKDGNAARRL